MRLPRVNTKRFAEIGETTSPRGYMRVANGGEMEATVAKFQVRECANGCFVLSCSGGLSWEDRELLASQIERFIEPRDSVRGFIIDLGAVEFVNSAGLGALFQLSQRLRARAIPFAFAQVPPTLQRLFQSVGLDRLARNYTDVATAVSMFEGWNTGAHALSPQRNSGLNGRGSAADTADVHGPIDIGE